MAQAGDRIHPLVSIAARTAWLRKHERHRWGAAPPVTAPLRCPLPSPTDPAEPCRVEEPIVGLLAAHLATAHLMSAGDAFRRAQEAAGRGNGPAAREITAERQDAAQAPAVSAPRTKEDRPMGSLSDPFPCKKCRRPFVRQHARERYCKKCTAAGPCTTCKRAAGHSDNCPRKGTVPWRSSPTKKPAPKPAPKPFATKRPAPSPEPPPPANVAAGVRDNAARAAAETLLGHLRKIRATFDERIAAVESVLAIL